MSLAALALVAAACGSDYGPRVDRRRTAPSKVYRSIGQGEGALKLIAWNGYIEDGSNGPNYDWVTPFEQQTGCKVNVKYADTSDEMVTLMRQGGGSVYDGVSASGTPRTGRSPVATSPRSTRRCSRSSRT